jgi:hypothetical protein
MTAEPLLKLAARTLARHRLDAVLIGNAAAALQGAPLTTVDLDFFIRRTAGNVRKLHRIADDLRAVVEQPFYPASKLFRLSRARDNLQFDFMMAISGIRSFEGVRARSSIVLFGRYPIRVASLEDIIRSKVAANRPEDRAALPVLRRTVKERDALYSSSRRRRA